MANIAGASRALKRFSADPRLDKTVADALRALEDKVEELDARVVDLERRVKAGGL